MKTIALDIDEPVANLIDAWLKVYNGDYNDRLEKQDISDWDLSKFTCVKCGKKIYDYLKDPHLYDNVYPTPMAEAGVRSLRKMGYRIIYVTASTVEQSGRKFKWLKDYKFIEKQDDYVEMTDKSLLKADVLFDDGIHNIQGFSGVGVLMTKTWNKNFDYSIRASNWYQFLNLIKGLNVQSNLV